MPRCQSAKMREYSVRADIVKRVSVCVKCTTDSNFNKSSNDEMLCILKYLKYSGDLENKQIRSKVKA